MLFQRLFEPKDSFSFKRILCVNFCQPHCLKNFSLELYKMDKSGGQVEAYTLNSSAGNSAPVGGRRHKLKKVSAKTIKKTLKRLGMKPKGRVVIRGGELETKEGEGVGMGGRRRRHTKKTHRRSRHLFGMRGLKY
jgi:hypothetical protein